MSTGMQGDNLNHRWLSRASGFLEVAALLLAIGPFILLGRFAHPQADDFCLANPMRALGFWEAQMVWWTQWTGRFVAIAMWNLGPLSFGSLQGYKLVSLVVLSGLFLAFLWLGREVIPREVPTRRVAWFGLTVLAVYLYQMASPAEGLYWFTGAVIFTWGTIFALIAIAAAVRSQRSGSGWSSWSWATVACVAAIVAAGSNEVTMLLLCLVLLVLAWLARRSRSPRWHLWLLPLTLAALSGLVDLLAPGNAKRAEATGGLMSPLGPLVGSAAFSVLAMIEWLSSGPLLIGVLAILIAGAAMSPQIPPDSRWRRTPWFLPCIVAGIGVWGSFFFTHWASGFSFRPGSPGRVLNVVQLFFLVMVTFSTFLIGVQVFGRYSSQMSDLRPATRWLTPLLALMLFGGGNVRRAYVDLVTRRAAIYDRELDQRYTAMRAAAQTHEAATVAPLSRIPETIFFRDITPDPTDWRNKCYADFWSIPEVKVYR